MDWGFVAALVIIFFRWLGRIFRSRPGIAIVIILGVIIFINSRNASSATPVAVYNENMPSVKAAPTLVQTSSRLYYVQKYTDDGKVLILQVFYAYDKKWVKYTTPLPIDRGVYGEVTVTARTN